MRGRDGSHSFLPVVLLGHDDKWEIHFAGGTSRITGDPATRRYEEHNTMIHRPLAELDGLVRAPTEYLELHCVLVRTQLFEQIGLFDEELIAARDHADLWLKAAAVGAASPEPAVNVRYTWPKRLRPTDYRFYLPRWSDEWSERSYSRFNARWQLADTSIDDVFRRATLDSPPERLTASADPRRVRLWRAGRRARRGLDMLLTPIVACRRPSAVLAAAHRAVHAASWGTDDAGAPRVAREHGVAVRILFATPSNTRRT